MNAAPTTSLGGLLDLAFDAGVEIVEAPLGGGFVIVTGAARAVAEWFNGVPAEYGMMQVHGDFATAARVSRPAKWEMA